MPRLLSSIGPRVLALVAPVLPAYLPHRDLWTERIHFGV